jgi:hypothetical protein
MQNGLPGADLIESGLNDLRAGRETVAALLVAIGAPRLRTLGLEISDNLPDNPEHRLYDLLARDDSDSAHSRYNAFVRRLVTFEATAEHAMNPPSSNPKFQRLVEQIVRADFPEGTNALRKDLTYLQDL